MLAQKFFEALHKGMEILKLFEQFFTALFVSFCQH